MADAGINAEFKAVVRAYLVARADGRPASSESIVALAKGVRVHGGDPVRLLFGLDGFASNLGETDAIRSLRQEIAAEWISEG